ncbi:MAG TPA: hypothetical protein VM409_05115 [Chloroflexia bacterium]|nr:hypothetical protein [Chloroflexia bacterium]
MRKETLMENTRITEDKPEGSSWSASDAVSSEDKAEMDDVSAYVLSIGGEFVCLAPGMSTTLDKYGDSHGKIYSQQECTGSRISSDLFPMLLGLVTITHPELKERPLGEWPV